MVRATRYIEYLKVPQLNTTAWAFKRSNTQPSRPTGGSYASPLPSSGGWTRQVPSGEEKLWCVTRVFTSDGLTPQDDNWSDPRSLSETSDFDMLFSEVQSPNPPSGHPNTNAQWSDISTGLTTWIAVSRKRNGAWTEWQVFRTRGDDGTSLTPKGSFSYYYATQSEADTAVSAGTWLQGKYALTISGGSPMVGYFGGTGPTYAAAQVGDAYLKEDTGEFYIAVDGGWRNVGVIRGPAGASAYIHIKFATSLTNGSWTGNNGETPGPYIGIYADNDAADRLDWDLYSWMQWKGADGYGYEYIYKRTSSASAPSVPSTSEDTDGYEPPGWKADPVGTTNSEKYCWICYRRKVEGVWSAWRGADANTAALWSKYGDKGDAAVVYELLPNTDSLEFHSNGNGAAFTPSSYRLRCGYVKTTGGTRETSDYPANGYIGSYYLLFRLIKADGTPDATFGGAQPYGWDWVHNNSTGYKDGNGNLVIPSDTTYSAVEFVISKTTPRNANDTTDIITRYKVPIRKISDGNRGSRGPRPRGPVAWEDCAVGTTFQQGAEGESFYDMVLYLNHIYSCKKTHNKTADNYPGSDADLTQNLWELALEADLVATKIVLATYALVKNLGVECIDMRDDNDAILCQIKDGNVNCKTGLFQNITVTDSVIKRQRNPFVQITNSFSALDDDTMFTENLGSHLWVTLGWDTSQSGRRICVVGSASFQAPANSSQHYFIDGKTVQSFQTSYEIVELIGLGTSSTFLGWMVVSRQLFRTTYFQGRELKTVAYGIVQATSSGVSFIQKRIGYAGDGDIGVTRGGAGIYHLWVPKAWFVSADYIHCMVCGRGVNKDAGGQSVVYANVCSITTGTYEGKECYDIEIRTADDATLNEGGFIFELKNLAAWDD